jgi:hypothetical protein
MYLGTILFVAAFIIIATITVIGNILVILAVFSNHRLRNPANFLMVNLAVSDLCQGALTMPVRIAEVMNTNDESLIRCDLVISLTILFHSASNFNLALIALDRFIAVSKPFAYANVMKTSIYKIIIALSWLCCLLLSGAIVVGWRKDIPEDAGAICRYGTTLTREYIILYVCVVDVTPLVIMLVTYSYIFRTTRRQIRQIRAHERAVHHAAINQGCECLKESDMSNASAHSQSNEEAPAAPSGIEVDHSMNPEPEEADDTAPAVHAIPEEDSPEEEIPEEESAGEMCNNNNCDIQNDAKESVTPENGHLSLSTIWTNNLDPIEAEISSTGETHNNYNNNHAVKEKVAPRNSNSGNVPLSTTQTRKATKTVMAIMGFFIILCLPITIIDVIELWCTFCPSTPPPVYTVALCMVASNSSVNVFVYGGYNTDYRKAYSKIWRRVKHAFLNIFTRTKNTAQSAAQTVSSRWH